MRGNFLKRIFLIIIPVMLIQIGNPVLAGNNSQTVYFTKGHGEQSIDKEYKRLKSCLIQNKFNAKTVDLDKEKALPSDLDVLVVLSPKTDLSAVEKNLLSAYLGKGGKMLLLMDVQKSGSRLANFEEITMRFNLLPGYDNVKENDTNRHIAEDCHTFVPDMPENVINKKPYDILVTETASINITAVNQDVNVLPLLESSMESVNEPAMTGMEEEGPLTVAAASEIKTAGSVSKVVLLGSSKTFSDSMFSKFGTCAPNNLKYFIDILKWMTKPKVTGLSAGSSHCLAVLSDGTLWAWGSNQHGQLGDGTQLDKSVPVQIGKDNDWVEVSAGTDYSLATKKDGSLWAWGSNDCGQLGDGTTKDKLKPIKVSYQRFDKVEAGRNYSLAIGADGTLWESGSITSDAFDADNKYRSKFRPVGRETNWVNISVSEYQAMGLKQDGTL